MTEDEIKEGNKLIAEFMGFSKNQFGEIDNTNIYLQWISTNINCVYDIQHDDFPLLNRDDYWKFHSSWDWLMPVVDKICDYEVVGDFHVCGSTVLIISAIECDDNPISGIEIWHSGGDDKKRAVFEACVKFIKQIK